MNHVYLDAENKQSVRVDSNDSSRYEIVCNVTHNVLCKARVADRDSESVSLESLLAMVSHRLRTLNTAPNQSITNRQALNHLTSAMLMLETRTLQLQESERI